MNSKKTLRNEQIFEIVFCALIIALIVLLSMPPYIGFGFAIPFTGVQITILHIPVIFGGIMLGRKYSWLLGLVFGLGSLWAAFNVGVFVFQNPLTAVLPRLLFGIGVYEIFNLLGKVIEDKKLLFIITAVLSTILHTVLVLVAVYLFGAAFYADTQAFINAFFLPAITFNALIEIVLAPIIGLPIFIALSNYKKNKDHLI